jgi:hypothetical protein
MLEIWLQSGNSQRRNLTFCYPPIEKDGLVHFPTGSTLHLEVEGCFDPVRDSKERSTLNVQTVTVSLPKDVSRLRSVYEDMPPELTYHVVPSSLPSIEKLLHWGRQGLILRAEFLNDDIESCLDMLLLAYMSQNPPLPLVSLSIIVLIDLSSPST